MPRPAWRTCARNRRSRPRSTLPKIASSSGFDAYQKAIAAGPDIVLLATPPGFRPIHYAAAVAAGKHVFMEKPVCVDAPGFRSVMETNKLADEKVVEGGRRPATPPQQGLHRADQADPRRLARRSDPVAGLLERRPRSGSANASPSQTEMEYQMRNWYHFVWLCGDHIVEQHVHNLDVCNWVKGDHPVKANGMGSCHVRDNRGIGQIYDNHFVEFTYKDGTKLYSQCRQQPNAWNSVTQFVHGVKGAKELPGNGSDGYTQEHVDLVNAIRKGRSSTTAGMRPPVASRRCWAAWRPTPGGGQLGRRRGQGPRRDAQAVRLRRRSAGHARQGRQLSAVHPRRVQAVLSRGGIAEHHGGADGWHALKGRGEPPNHALSGRATHQSMTDRALGRGGIARNATQARRTQTHSKKQPPCSGSHALRGNQLSFVALRWTG